MSASMSVRLARRLFSPSRSDPRSWLGHLSPASGVSLASIVRARYGPSTVPAGIP